MDRADDAGSDTSGGGECTDLGGAADITARRDAKRSFSHAVISSVLSFSNLVAPECHPL